MPPLLHKVITLLVIPSCCQNKAEKQVRKDRTGQRWGLVSLWPVKQSWAASTPSIYLKNASGFSATGGKFGESPAFWLVIRAPRTYSVSELSNTWHLAPGALWAWGEGDHRPLWHFPPSNSWSYGEVIVILSGPRSLWLKQFVDLVCYPLFQLPEPKPIPGIGLGILPLR